MVKVSTLLLTYNEALNLPACFEALSWCDDILVLDSGSTDGSVDLARQYGARVMMRPFDDFAGQRNYGLEQGDLCHDWVLHLDADEIVTAAFVAALAELEPPSHIDAYRVPSKLMLFGQWLRYAGMYPAFQVRLGRRNKLRFKQVGHGQREDLAAERIADFPEPYLHYSFSHGMRRWLKKHMHYASDEADLIVAQRADRKLLAGVSVLKGDKVARRRAAKAQSSKIPLLLRPPLRFLYLYFYRQAFRDGHAGLIYSVMLSVYEGMITIFAYEKLFLDAMGEQSSSQTHSHQSKGPCKEESLPERPGGDND